VIAPKLGWIDNSGSDILVWSDGEFFPLVAQCKGFKVPEERVGQRQIDQCLESIKTFRKSSIQAENYLLIHNRTSKNQELRLLVEKELRNLVASGQVQ